jgi:hypothetical protein
MPRVGFESTIPVFERAKTFHALDRAAAVIGSLQSCICLKIFPFKGGEQKFYIPQVYCSCGRSVLLRLNYRYV